MRFRAHLLRAVAAGVLVTGPPARPAEPDLALRWAPIHHQEVDPHGPHAAGGRADEITRVDFDGDWDARNNWAHALDHPPVAAAYVSQVETGTHWFLTYLYFHARDWTDRPLLESEHENDAEGVLLVVAKDGSRYGRLRAAVTVAHADFYSYVPPGSPWRSGGQTVDGTLPMQRSPADGLLHPATAQEAHGHGLTAWRGRDRGIVYYPGRDYELRDLAELWSRRGDPALFAAPGTFAGGCAPAMPRCVRDAAHAPWAWDDHDDAVPAGALATDPARLVAAYFTVPEPLSRTYLRNPITAAG
jgi:hypothetical protein